MSNLFRGRHVGKSRALSFLCALIVVLGGHAVFTTAVSVSPQVSGLSLFRPAPAEAGAHAGPRFAEIRPDSSYVDPALPPNPERVRDYDILHTALDLRFDWTARSVLGVVQHRLTPLRKVTDVHFDQHGMSFSGVGHAAGGALEWTVTGDTVTVHLDRPYNPGEELTLRLDYRVDRPVAGIYFMVPDDAYPDRPRQIWTQGEAEENHYWFPCYDNPGDRGTSEQFITVERSLTVAANGRLVDRRENADGTDTWHFRLDVPHPAYLQALAVGEYRILRADAGGTPVLSYVRPSRFDWAERSFGESAAMIELFEKLLGFPYPYSIYRQVEVEEYLFGGMENTTVTILTGRTLHDEEVAKAYGSESLVAHEIAHQWLGDYVSPRTWAHTWLNEGFATYLETVYWENRVSLERARWDVYKAQESYLSEDRDHYRRPMVTAFYEHPDDLFDNVGYGKASAVVHMLRNRLGDREFWASLNRYLTEYGPGVVETGDLRRAAEAVSGQDLSRFFAQWAYQAGHPEFEVSWEWDAKASAARVTVRQVQAVDARTPVFRVPLDLDFTGTGWHRTLRVWSDAPATTFVLDLPGRPDFVEVDRENWILKTIDFDKPDPEWIRQLRRSPSVISRVRAASALGASESEAAVAALDHCLRNRSEFWGVRGEAASALAEQGGEYALRFLLTGLRSDNARVRKAVADALGELGDPAALIALDRLVTDDPSVQVAAAAVEAAGEIGGEEALSVIRAGLDRESWRNRVRASALDALGSMADPATLDWILAHAVPGSPMEVRESAVYSLGSLGAEMDAADPLLDTIRVRLESEMGAGIIQIRIAAAESLGELGAKARPTLEGISASDDQPMVTRAARNALRDLDRDRDDSPPPGGANTEDRQAAPAGP